MAILTLNYISLKIPYKGKPQLHNLYAFSAHEHFAE